MLQRLRQEDGCEFEASLGYKVRSYLKKSEEQNTTNLTTTMNKKRKRKEAEDVGLPGKKSCDGPESKNILGPGFVMRLEKELSETET